VPAGVADGTAFRLLVTSPHAASVRIEVRVAIRPAVILFFPVSTLTAARRSLLFTHQSRYPWRMQVDQKNVLEALKVVNDPDLHRDIVSLGFIKNLNIDGGRVAFTIELTTPACPVKDQMRDQARAAVMQVPGVSAVEVQMTARV